MVSGKFSYRAKGVFPRYIDTRSKILKYLRGQHGQVALAMCSFVHICCSSKNDGFAKKDSLNSKFINQKTRE